MKALAYAPLLAFAALLTVFALRLSLVEEGDTPDLVPSVMTGKPAPAFALPLLDAKGLFSDRSLKGEITLVNFFASWCASCRIEHPLLSALKGKGVRLAGLAYKDASADVSAYLRRGGNPYDAVALDSTGRTGIDFGVYGVPESYLIDSGGVIRYKQTGPLTLEDINHKILPLAKALRP